MRGRHDEQGHRLKAMLKLVAIGVAVAVLFRVIGDSLLWTAVAVAIYLAAVSGYLVLRR